MYDGSSVGGDEVVQHFGTARAAPACLAENIFVGDGYAGKRSGVALRDTCVGGTRFGEGFVLIEGDVAVDSRVLRSNGGEVFGGQFDGRDLFGLQQLAGLGEGISGHKLFFRKGFSDGLKYLLFGFQTRRMLQTIGLTDGD